jgi:hypothetical protein
VGASVAFVRPYVILVRFHFFYNRTMERESIRGEVATAHSLARLLSTTPPACRGPAQITLLDLHTLQNQFYFSDQVSLQYLVYL